MSRNDVLVPADWAQEHIGQPGIVFVEVDEDTSAYDKGHIEGAFKLDWRTDLQDPLRRDFVDREQFEQLLSAPGGAEAPSAYDKGHIEGAVKLDWRTDLQDPLRRDFVDREQFEQLLSAKGIANEDTVVLYGGNNNWFAAYAYWYLKLYGHDQVKLLDGGRKKWELDSRPLSPDAVERPPTQYPAPEAEPPPPAPRG